MICLGDEMRLVFCSSFDSMNLLSIVHLNRVFILSPLRSGPLFEAARYVTHNMISVIATARTQTHTHTYWRQVNQRDEAHKTPLTAGANCRSWCLSKRGRGTAAVAPLQCVRSGPDAR